MKIIMLALAVITLLIMVTPVLLADGDPRVEPVPGESVLDWLIANFGAMVAGAILIVSGLAILAKSTKTPKDDKFFAKILEFLNLWPKAKA